MSSRTKDFAGCVILDDHDRVLLVHHTYGKKEWTLPGGVVEDGESAWEAMKRECQEEIGVEVESSLAGVYFLSHRNAYGFIFKAATLSGVPTPDQKEIDAIGYFGLEQLPSPMSNFTVQRIEDACQFRTRVFLRTQHISDYHVGNPKSIRR